MTTHSTLISAAQLQQHMDSGQPLRVFDCSFDLFDHQLGPSQFADAHIAGARHAHLERDLSAHGYPDSPLAAASAGRHPLPAREDFASWLTLHGVTRDTQVVVYDRQGQNYCGRLWWMLKWCGHDAVAVLDGGWAAWQAMGGATESGAAVAPTAVSDAPPDTPFTVGQALVALTNTQSVLDGLGQLTHNLIDARAAPRFRGEVEPVDPIAGHIPGALNRPFSQNLGADGCFKPAEQLRAEFLELLDGRDPQSVVHHCGSGVSAVPNLLAMQLAGLGCQPLYAGSWSEWSRTPGLPVATGA